MLTVAELAQLIGAPAVDHGGDRVITGAAALLDAGPGDVSILVSERHSANFVKTSALAVLVRKGLPLPEKRPPSILIYTENPDLAMTMLLARFDRQEHVEPGIHPTAVIHPTATLGEDVRIGPGVYVGPRSTVAARTSLHAGVVIGEECTVGSDCEFFGNVVLRRRVTVGNRCMLHAGCVIGTDGFGYAWDPKAFAHVKIPHVGTVVLGDDVEIGSCTCIDRGKYSATTVGNGTKIDNLVQIGHNCTIGRGCLICGQSALAGSVTVGDFTVLGGQTTARDNVKIGPGVRAGAMTGIAYDIAPGQAISGVPALPHRQHLREQAALHKLPELLVEFRKMKDEVERLKAELGQHRDA